MCSDEEEACEKYTVELEEEEEEEWFDDEDEDEDEEKPLVALGWWKVYRSGWWEDSHGAKTHFDETYVEYRFSALLPPVPEEVETDSP